MKSIIVFIILLCSCSFVFAQDVAVNNNTTVGYRQLVAGNYTYPYKKEHCGATIGGEVCLIGGVGMILIGAVIPQPSNPDNKPSSQGLIGAFFLVGGALIVAEGVVFFTGGEIYDHFHNRRYSVISKDNQLGLAYNF
jgi:hypothetical protein